MTDSSHEPETPETPETKPGHDDDASASQTNDRSAEEAGGHTIPIEDEQPGPDHAREEDLQEENAETSLDQPSGG